MFNLRKIAAYQTEVGLGLGALAILLVAMNLTGNRTLGVVTRTLAESSEAEMTSLALETVRKLEKSETRRGMLHKAAEIGDAGGAHPLRLLDRELNVIFTTAVSEFTGPERPEFQVILEELKLDLSLLNEYRYIRAVEAEREFFVCPVFVEGEWFTLAISAQTGLLASIERATETLVRLGIVIAMIVAVALIALYRALTRPYTQISSAVSTVVTSATDPEGAVSELVERYKQIIKELRDKEQRLVELNETLQSRVTDVERLNEYLLGSMSTGIIILDGRGNLAGINRIATERLELPESLVGLTLNSSALPHEDYVGLFAEMPGLKTWVERILLKGVAEEFDYELEGESGKSKALRLSAVPLKDNTLREDERLGELVLFVSDQTELALTKRRLEESRQLATLGEMSAGLAHQLRNSILASLGFASLAMKKSRATAEVFEPLDSLVRELNEQSQLVDRFLGYSRRLELSSTKIEIDELLETLLSGYTPYEDTNSRVLLKTSGSGVVEVDLLLLKQSLINLIDNALSATESDWSPVEVRAELTGDSVIISVSDSGPGVSPELSENMFTPFVSGSASGVGLGLPLARKIIELHGGKLEYDSPAGGGATFAIHLPRFSEHQQAHNLTQ